MSTENLSEDTATGVPIKLTWDSRNSLFIDESGTVYDSLGIVYKENVSASESGFSMQSTTVDYFCANGIAITIEQKESGNDSDGCVIVWEENGKTFSLEMAYNCIVVGGGWDKECASTQITMNGGGIGYGLFGGGVKDTATVTGNVSVNVYGGTMHDGVVGGGINGDVNGDVSVTIGNDDGGPVISENIIGGGFYGDVNGSVVVNINNGKIGPSAGDAVFCCGGGVYGTVGKDVTVNMNGGDIYGIVAGGPMLNNGTVSGNTHVNVTGGTVCDVAGGGAGHMYGGASSDKITVEGNTQVNISGGTVSETVSGGGGYFTPGCVGGDTEVNITGGTIGSEEPLAGHTYGIFSGNCSSAGTTGETSAVCGSASINIMTGDGTNGADIKASNTAIDKGVENAPLKNYTVNETVIIEDGKVSENIDMSKLYVDSSLAETLTGTELGDGKVFGVNTFATVEDLLAVAEEGASIYIADAELKNEERQIYAFGNKQSAVITGKVEGSQGDARYILVGADSYFGNTPSDDTKTGYLKIAKGASLKYGQLNADANGVVDIYGDADLAIVNAEAGGIEGAKAGIINVHDGATLKMATAGVYSGGALNIYKGGTVTVYHGDNPECAIMAVDGEGSVVNVSGTLDVSKNAIANGATIAMDGGTLLVQKLENNGDLKVSGESTIEAGEITGNAIQLTGTLKDSTVGDINVYGTDAKLNNVTAGNIRVGFERYTDADAALAITGTLNAGILYAGVKTTGSDADYAGYNYGLQIGTPNAEDAEVVRNEEGRNTATVKLSTLNLRPTADVSIDNATLNLGDWLIRSNNVTVNNSKIDVGLLGNGTTGNWAIYEDDDPAHSPNLTLNKSDISGNYLVVGNQDNGGVSDATSSATLNLNDTTLVLTGDLIVAKDTDAYAVTANLNSFSVAVNDLKNGGTVNVNASKVDADTVSNDGTINLDAASTLIGGTYTGDGTITIDAAGFTGTINVVKEFSNNGIVNVTGGEVTASTITNGNGNEFNVTGGSVTADTVKNNGEFNVSGNSSLNIGNASGNAINLLDGTVLTDSTYTGAEYGNNFTAAGNVEFAGTNKLSNAQVVVSNASTLVVNGTLTADALLQLRAEGTNSSVEINGSVSGNYVSLSLKNDTAKLTVNSSASINISGDNGLNATKGSASFNGSLANDSDLANAEEVQFFLANTRVETDAAEVEINNAVYKTTNLLNNGGSMDVNNARLNIENGFAWMNAGSLNVNDSYLYYNDWNNGGRFNIEDGASVNVNDSVFDATTVNNNGTVNVSGESTLIVDNASGKAINLLDGTTLANSLADKAGFVYHGNVTVKDSELGSVEGASDSLCLTVNGIVTIGTVVSGSITMALGNTLNVTNWDGGTLTVTGNLTGGHNGEVKLGKLDKDTEILFNNEKCTEIHESEAAIDESEGVHFYFKDGEVYVKNFTVDLDKGNVSGGDAGNLKDTTVVGTSANDSITVKKGEGADFGGAKFDMGGGKNTVTVNANGIMTAGEIKNVSTVTLASGDSTLLALTGELSTSAGASTVKVGNKASLLAAAITKSGNGGTNTVSFGSGATGTLKGIADNNGVTKAFEAVTTLSIGNASDVTAAGSFSGADTASKISLGKGSILNFKGNAIDLKTGKNTIATGASSEFFAGDVTGLTTFTAANGTGDYATIVEVGNIETGEYAAKISTGKFTEFVADNITALNSITMAFGAGSDVELGNVDGVKSLTLSDSTTYRDDSGERQDAYSSLVAGSVTGTTGNDTVTFGKNTEVKLVSMDLGLGKNTLKAGSNIVFNVAGDGENGIAGDLVGLTTLTLENGSMFKPQTGDKNQMFTTVDIVGALTMSSAYASTISIGNFADLSVGGTIGNNGTGESIGVKITVGKNSSLKAGGISNLTSLSLTAGAKYSDGSGIVDGFTTLQIKGDITGTAARNTISAGNNSEITVGSINLRGGKNTISLGGQNVTFTSGDITNVQSFKISNGKSGENNNAVVTINGSYTGVEGSNIFSVGSYANVTVGNIQTSNVGAYYSVTVGSNAVMNVQKMEAINTLTVSKDADLLVANLSGSERKDTITVNGDLIITGSIDLASIEKINVSSTGRVFASQEVLDLLENSTGFSNKGNLVLLSPDDIAQLSDNMEAVAWADGEGKLGTLECGLVDSVDCLSFTEAGKAYSIEDAALEVELFGSGSLKWEDDKCTISGAAAGDIVKITAKDDKPTNYKLSSVEL